MKSYYIFSHGDIKQKDNTFYFNGWDPETQQSINRRLPIEQMDSLYLFGQVNINSAFLHFMSQHGIMVHFFNYYGWYDGSYVPKESLLAGDLIVKQARHCLELDKRLYLAKEFLLGGVHAMRANMARAGEHDAIAPLIDKVDSLRLSLKEQSSISAVMGVEGNIRENYYKSFNILLKNDRLDKRVKNPPDSPVNALISFLNGMTYSTILKEIYKTQLNPTISFLHEPGVRRYSLALDIAEIFKPLYADRLVFSLLNDRELSSSLHFEGAVNGAYLKENGRKIVVQAWDKKLNTVIQHKKLKRKVSYREIMRLEMYRLIKHILGERDYSSFKAWW
jgi:CRISPR-associated protein Cas1